MSLVEIVERFHGIRALVVGDPMVDDYVFGSVIRISPEAPVPVFVPERQESRRGGADNVVAQLEAFGCSVRALFPPRPWTVKTRCMVGHHPLLRIDRDVVQPIIDVPKNWLHFVSAFDVVVLSDYAKGALTEAICQHVINMARSAQVPVVVDPKGKNWDKYVGCDVICPNEAEMSAFLNNGEPTRPVFKAVLAKHGAEGLALMREENGEQQVKLYATQPRKVFDVTGAGDTVVATVAVALAAGATLEQCAELANLAAGVVVEEVGTSVCSFEALRGEVKVHESRL